jgi:hypothetical protein
MESITQRWRWVIMCSDVRPWGRVVKAKPLQTYRQEQVSLHCADGRESRFPPCTASSAPSGAYLEYKLQNGSSPL